MIRYTVRQGTSTLYPSVRVRIDFYATLSEGQTQPEIALEFRKGETAEEQQVAVKDAVALWVTMQIGDTADIKVPSAVLGDHELA